MTDSVRVEGPPFSSEMIRFEGFVARRGPTAKRSGRLIQSRTAGNNDNVGRDTEAAHEMNKSMQVISYGSAKKDSNLADPHLTVPAGVTTAKCQPR